METEIELRAGQANIFNLQNPERYSCAVEEIKPGGFSYLRVRIRDEQGRGFADAVFRGVRFFDGSLEWSGASFRVASPEQCLALLRLLGWIHEDVDSAIVAEALKLISLIEIPTPHYTIRLLTGSAYYSEGILP